MKAWRVDPPQDAVKVHGYTAHPFTYGCYSLEQKQSQAKLCCNRLDQMAHIDTNHGGDAEVNLSQLANAIRVLSMDAVERAQSGHPGMPMGMADVATTLYADFLKFDPSQPEWADRDRVVLSAGHGSMLLYSLLYLTGYKSVSIKDIQNFRQLDSICAGHPEYIKNSGIETTTGPLGQGLSNAVGIAIAEEIMKK